LFSLAKAALVSSMLLIGSGVALKAVAQINPNPTPGAPAKSTEITTNDSILPLVYSVENTGATSVAPTFPSFANLPVIRPLPDPFTFISTGARDTSFAAWEQHRNEILAGFENYMVGPKPTCSDCTITATYVPTSSTAGTLTTTIQRTNSINGLVTITLTSAVTLPSATAPTNGWPYVIGIDGAYGSLGASTFPGVASIVFTSSQVTTSGGSSLQNNPFYKMYAPLCPFECTTLPAAVGTAYNGNAGQFAAWSWGISRLLDGIQIAAQATGNGHLPFDMTHSAVTGCSYAGKIALYGGALDERIALTIAQENGGGGVPSWRGSYNMDAEYGLGTHDGAVEDIDTTDHHWWADTLMQNQFSSVNLYKMPIDLHEVASMAAPRALIETGNSTQYWLGQESNYVSARAIQQVYNTFGIGDRFGFIIDGGHGHCATTSNITTEIGTFVNKFLLGQNTNTDIEVYPNGPGQPTTPPTSSTGTPTYPSYPMYFPSMDYQRWYSWWGTSNPQFANSWNTGGTTDLWFNNPLTISTGDTVKAGYAIQMSAATHPAATVQVNNANIQMDVTCSDSSSYTLLIPMSTSYGTGQTFTIPANNISWYPSADPTDSATFQGSISGTGASVCTSTGTCPAKGGEVTTWNNNVMGSIINPGCANGLPGTAGRAYFSSLGVATTSNGNPAGPGFVTTDATLSPIVLRFHAEDATTGQGGAWSPAVTINQLPLNYNK
jgi:hypothetical protein